MRKESSGGLIATLFLLLGVFVMGMQRRTVALFSVLGLFLLLTAGVAAQQPGEDLKAYLPTAQELAQHGLRGSEPWAMHMGYLNGTQGLFGQKPTGAVVQDLGTLGETGVFAQVRIYRFDTPETARKSLEYFLHIPQNREISFQAAAYGDAGYSAGYSQGAAIMFQKGSLVASLDSSYRQFTPSIAGSLARIIDGRMGPSATPVPTPAPASTTAPTATEVAPPLPAPARTPGFEVVFATLTLAAVALWKVR